MEGIGGGVAPGVADPRKKLLLYKNIKSKLALTWVKSFCTWSKSVFRRFSSKTKWSPS
jgi:hypothetical protein